MPFYRQVQIFKRQQLSIPESTIGGWFNASCRLLEPLYGVLKTKLVAGDYLQADETPIPVQTQDKPGATHKGYHWVYFDPGNKLVLFDYRKTRGREGPDELLKNFSGYLQTDGYTAYNNLKNGANITQLACMAHARRKFEHAKENDPALATEALLMFGRLHEVERDAREKKLSHEEIHQLRQEKSAPVLLEMETWLKEKLNKVLPKSAIGQAIAYTLTLWPRLVRYIDQGRFYIDNNLIENSIRPVALGLKNYMFAGSHDAAQQAAILYSLLATCKINNIEPFEWLSNTLSVISDHHANQSTNFCPGKDRYLHPIILDAVGRRLTNSIPSNNGKYNLILFVEDNSFLFVRGELDYFNDRNPGQIIPDHNSNYSSFYLEAGDTQVFFDKFKCLYNYGAYSWWDSSSRYFYFASAVNLFFIFDCQEYKWAQISTPFDIVSGYIENGLVMIDGFEPFNVAGTLKVGANAPMLTLQLSDLSWKTKGLEIKKHELENLQPATLPRQESIALNKQSVAPKEHSSSQKSFKKNLVKGIKIILSIGIIFAVAGLAVSLRAGHRSVFLLVSLCLGAISLIFLSDNDADSLEDDLKEMYRAWLVIKFGYWLPLFIIILTGTITAFSDEYRTSLFNQFAFGLSIAYLIFIPFTEMRGILLLKGNSEDREICRERYKSERKKGKKTLHFFLELHLRKLIFFFILAGAVVLFVELSDYLFSLFQ